MVYRNCGYFLYQMHNQKERYFNLYGVKNRNAKEIKLPFGFTFYQVEERDNGVVNAYIDDQTYIIISTWDLGLQDSKGYNPLGYNIPVFTGHNR